MIIVKAEKLVVEPVKKGATEWKVRRTELAGLVQPQGRPDRYELTVYKQKPRFTIVGTPTSDPRKGLQVAFQLVIDEHTVVTPYDATENGNTVEISPAFMVKGATSAHRFRCLTLPQRDAWTEQLGLVISGHYTLTELGKRTPGGTAIATPATSPARESFPLSTVADVNEVGPATGVAGTGSPVMGSMTDVCGSGVTSPASPGVGRMSSPAGALGGSPLSSPANPPAGASAGVGGRVVDLRGFNIGMGAGTGTVSSVGGAAANKPQRHYSTAGTGSSGVGVPHTIAAASSSCSSIGMQGQLHSPMPGRRASTAYADDGSDGRGRLSLGGSYPAAAAACAKEHVTTPVKGAAPSNEASELDGSAAGARSLRSPLQLRQSSPVDFTGARRRLSSPDRGGVGAHGNTMGSGMGAGSTLGAQAARAVPLLRQEVEALSAMNQSLNDALEAGERHWTDQQARYTSQLEVLTAEVARLAAENGTAAAAAEEAAAQSETELAAFRKEVALNKAAVCEGVQAVQEMGMVQADIGAAVERRIGAELENLALVRKERGTQSATIATMREETDVLTMKFKKSVIVRVEQDNTIRDVRSQLARAESYKVLLEQSEGEAAAKQERVSALETELSGATVELRDRSARVESLEHSLTQSEELFKAHTADANAASEGLSRGLRDSQTHVSELTAANTVLSSEVSAAQEQTRLLESQLAGDSSGWQVERDSLTARAAHLEASSAATRVEEKRAHVDATAKVRALAQAEASIVALEGQAEQRERARVSQEEEAVCTSSLLQGKLAACEKALGVARQHGVEAQGELSAMHASAHSATQEAEASRASDASAVAASKRGEQTARKLAEALRAELEQTRARALKEAQDSEASHTALKTELDDCAANIRRDADSAVQRAVRASSKLAEALRAELELTRARAAQVAQDGEEGYATLAAELKTAVDNLNAVGDAEATLKRDANGALARYETEMRQVQLSLADEQRRVGALTVALATSEALRGEENAAAASAQATLQEELTQLKGATLAGLKQQLSLLQRHARETTARMEVLSADLADAEGARDALLREIESARHEHSATRVRLVEATSSLEGGERAAVAAAAKAEQLDEARVRLNEVETHACLLADQLATSELKLEMSNKDASRYSALYKQATEAGVVLHAEASARIAELETALSAQDQLAQSRLLCLHQAQTNEEALTQRLDISGAVLKERDANARDLSSQLSTCREAVARLQSKVDESCDVREKAHKTADRLSSENAVHIATIKDLRGECDDGAAQAEALSAAAEQAKERHSSGQAVLAELQSALRAATEDLGAMKLERGMTQQKVTGLEDRVREMSAGAVVALSELDARSAHLKNKEVELKVVQTELGHTSARLDELLALSDGLEAKNSAQAAALVTDQTLLLECRSELEAATERWQESVRVLQDTTEELTQAQLNVTGLERRLMSVQDINAELHKTLKEAQRECGAVQVAHDNRASALASALVAAAAAADLRQALDASTAEANDLQRSQHALSLDRQKQTAAINKLTATHESLQAALSEHEGREQALESKQFEQTLELADTQRALAASAGEVKKLEQTSERRKVQLSKRLLATSTRTLSSALPLRDSAPVDPVDVIEDLHTDNEELRAEVAALKGEVEAAQEAQRRVAQGNQQRRQTVASAVEVLTRFWRGHEHLEGSLKSTRSRMLSWVSTGGGGVDPLTQALQQGVGQADSPSAALRARFRASGSSPLIGGGGRVGDHDDTFTSLDGGPSLDSLLEVLSARLDDTLETFMGTSATVQTLIDRIENDYDTVVLGDRPTPTSDRLRKSQLSDAESLAELNERLTHALTVYKLLADLSAQEREEVVARGEEISRCAEQVCRAVERADAAEEALDDSRARVDALEMRYAREDRVRREQAHGGGGSASGRLGLSREYVSAGLPSAPSILLQQHQHELQLQLQLQQHQYQHQQPRLVLETSSPTVAPQSAQKETRQLRPSRDGASDGQEPTVYLQRRRPASPQADPGGGSGGGGDASGLRARASKTSVCASSAVGGTTATSLSAGARRRPSSGANAVQSHAQVQAHASLSRASSGGSAASASFSVSAGSRFRQASAGRRRFSMSRIDV